MSAPRELQIHVPAFLGVSADYLVSAECSFRLDGGTFSFVFANEPGVPSFASKTICTVYDSLQGVIDDVTYGKGSAGKTVRVVGRIFPPALNHIRPKTYLATYDWLLPDGTAPLHLNDRSIYAKDPTVELVADLKFSTLVNKLCTEHGLVFQFCGPFIDYRIFKRDISGSRPLYEELQALAQPAGMNLVLYNNQLLFIPWGGRNPHGSVQVSCDRLTSDFDYTVATSEFDQVVVRASSEMTPYNSVYAGLPEKITTLTFEAGPTSVKDISFGEGVVQPDKIWQFPLTTLYTNIETAKAAVNDNAWYEIRILYNQEKDSAAHPITSYIKSTAEVVSVWDYELLRAETVDYKRMFKFINAQQLKAKKLDLNTLLEEYTLAKTNYRVLIRWNHAQTLLPAPGDIHPFIYVIPSDLAPDELGMQGFIPDGQQMTLVGPGQTSQTVMTELNMNPGLSAYTFSMPADYEGITPSGYGFTASFNPDGSIPVDARFTPVRQTKKYLDKPIIVTKINPTDSFYTDLFGTATFVEGKDYVDIHMDGYEDHPDRPSNCPTLAFHLREIWGERTNSQCILPTRDYASNIDVTGGPVVTDNNFVEDTNALEAFNRENKQLANALYINRIEEHPDTDGTRRPDYARVYTNTASAIAHTGNYSFARGRISTAVPLRQKISSTGKLLPFQDSGLCEENNETISCSWALYGLRRKCYPGICAISKVLGPFTYYSGISEEADIDVAQGLKAFGNRNTKDVTSDLITDFLDRGSHLEQLAQKIFAYVTEPYTRFSVTAVGETFHAPPLGGEITVDGVQSQLIGASFSLSRRGFLWTYEAGALPVL